MTLCPHGKWEGSWGCLALVSVSPQTNFLRSAGLWCAHFETTYDSKRATNSWLLLLYFCQINYSGCMFCLLRTIPKYVMNLKNCCCLCFNIFNLISRYSTSQSFHYETMWALICIKETICMRWTHSSSPVNTNSSQSGVINGSWALVSPWSSWYK